jgi:hypothetical protein
MPDFRADDTYWWASNIKNLSVVKDARGVKQMVKVYSAYALRSGMKNLLLSLVFPLLETLEGTSNIFWVFWNLNGYK